MMALLLRSLIGYPIRLCLLCLCCGLATCSYAQETTQPAENSPFTDDAQDAAFDRDAKQLAVRLRSATPDQRETLKQELKALNEKHFEHRQRRRKRELDELTAGVERLRSAYQKRQEQRADVLARRFSDLTAPNTNRNWDDVAEATNGAKSESNTRVPSAKPDSTSTYDGVPLAQWLKTLEHERNREKVVDAVIALNYLVDQADPYEVLSAVFKLVIAQSTKQQDQYSEAIRRGAICLLLQLPSDIVVEAIQSSWEQGYAHPEPRRFISLTLAELATKTDEDDSAAFLARFPQARRNLPLAVQGMSTQGIFTLPSKETMSPHQTGVKSLAPRLIQLLVNAVERNPEVRSAAVEDGNLVLRISRQPLTTYPEFVPIVEADLEDPNSSHTAAARLLAECGLKIPKVIEFINLQFAEFDKNPSSILWRLNDILHDLELLAPHTPDAVDLLIERFRKDCSKLVDVIKSRDENDVSGNIRHQSDICGQYILALARIGKPAERIIPELQKIAESVQVESGGSTMVDSQWPWTFHRFWFDLTGEIKWPFSLQELSDAAIKVIQNPKPKTPPATEARAQSPAARTNVSATPATTKNRSELAKRRERAEALVKHLESLDHTGGASEELYKQAQENLLLLKELEALSAANDTAKAKPAAPKDEPTYKGVVLSEWMRTLKHERDRAKIADAVMAANYLADQADPEQMIPAVFSVLKSEANHATQDSFTAMIQGGALLVLTRLPAQLVVEQLAVEFNDSSVPTELSKSLALGNFRNSLGQLLKHLVLKTRTPLEYRGGSIQIQDPVTKNYFSFPESKATMDALRTQIRRRSRHLIRILADVAQREPKLRQWAITTADSILLISQQPITTYPELIPIAEAAMEDPNLAGQSTAVELLAESGLQIPQVMVCVRRAIEHAKPQDQTGRPRQSSFGTMRCLILAAPHTPEAVELIVDHLRASLSAQPRFQGSPISQLGAIPCIYALAAIGTPARSVIPILKEIRDSKDAEVEVVDQTYFDRAKMPLLAAVFPPNNAPFSPSNKKPTIRDVIDAAIQEIETDKPKPVVEPLLEDEDLSTSRDATSNAPVAKLETHESKPEPTFDGTPYSAWLKMLETERKSEKLGQAIEATTRLATADDQQRIAKAIFIAASRVERETDRSIVWEPGFSGLRRLSAPVVVAALTEALGDKSSYTSGRRFQGIFAARRTSKEIDAEIQKDASTIIQLLLERGSSPESASDELVVAAFQFLKQSHLDLANFPSAQEIGLRCVERSLEVYQPSAGRGISDGNPVGWDIITDTLIELAPETAGLPEVLMKQHRNAPEVIERVGRLGEHARSVTPQLVDLFLKQAVLSKSVPSASAESRFPTTMNLFIIRALGQIHASDDGYRLVRECKLIAPDIAHSKDQQLKRFFESVEQAWPNMIPPEIEESKAPLLTDEILISGVWTLNQDSSKAMPQDLIIEVALPQGPIAREMQGWRLNDKGALEMVLNPFHSRGIINGQPFVYISINASHPKHVQISDGKNDVTKTWLYELTETSLRLLAVKEDQTLPDTFPSADQPLPDGWTLLEFQRHLQKSPEKTPDR